MDDQGRSRSPDARGTAATGPRHALGAPTSPQPALGSGAQQVIDTRTPVRGFPPARGQGGTQGQPGESGSWPAQPGGSGSWPAQPGGSGSWPAQPGGSGSWPAQPGGSGSWPAQPATAPQAAISPATAPQAPASQATAPQASVAEDDDLYVLGDGYPSDDILFPQGGGYADEGHAPADPGAAATPRQGRGSRRREAKGHRGRFRVTLIAVGVLVLGGGALAGYKYLYEPRVNAPVPSSFRLPATSQALPDFDQALGKWQHIGTRAEDHDPLTVAGLYPVQFDLSNASFTRAAASVTKDCSLAVYGPELQAALASGHCSQVVRASYVSGKMMGTIGVVNLISVSAAEKAGAITGPKEVIAPLSSAHGVTSKLGSGTGVVQAEVKGHYLILIWAEFTDLKKPTSAGTAQLETFATNLVIGSANINLSTRMLTGK
jgi:hypothetical protein